jgi:hypothetical protein
MVRTATSNRSARRWALRARGALARSSSTRAYRRSVRFMVAARYRADVTAAPGFAAGDLNGCAGLIVATPIARSAPIAGGVASSSAWPPARTAAAGPALLGRSHSDL